MASEHSMIMTICPYSGLLSQDYKCAECQSYIRIRNIKVSPGNTEIQLCNFTYCFVYKYIFMLK